MQKIMPNTPIMINAINILFIIINPLCYNNAVIIAIKPNPLITLIMLNFFVKSENSLVMTNITNAIIIQQDINLSINFSPLFRKITHQDHN